LRTLISCIESISRLLGYVGAVLVMLLVVLMVYEVIVRYVLSAPTIWGYEITSWVMGGSFVLAIAYALATDSHIRIDFAHDILGRRAGRMIDLCGYVLFILPLLVWLTWGLWDYFYGAFKTGERSGQSAWNPVVWPFRLILFVGVLVWTLQVIAEIVKLAFALVGRPLSDTGPEHVATE
jgi:TRAP-type mannitol/chloroaromatic compound transport system permease small subunit